uniref:Uncharacterized protein n=1 Tax=Anguilla anguilla TaxID=7936 RepID=A0A0E9QZ36_ANGAN
MTILYSLLIFFSFITSEIYKSNSYYVPQVYNQTSNILF